MGIPDDLENELIKALKDAFPDKQKLKIMLRLKLNFRDIIDSNNIEEILFDLIENEKIEINSLLRGSLRQVPHNRAVRSFIKKYLQFLAEDLGENLNQELITNLVTILLKTNNFNLVVNTLKEILPEREIPYIEEDLANLDDPRVIKSTKIFLILEILLKDCFYDVDDRGSLLIFTFVANLLEKSNDTQLQQKLSVWQDQARRQEYQLPLEDPNLNNSHEDIQQPAQEVSSVFKTLSFEVATIKESPATKILKLSFVTATIKIQKTRNFEFSVATLERKPGICDIDNSWQINRQLKQGIVIIENLGSNIELELIEVSGGSFMMGAPEDELEISSDETSKHQVNVASFYMGRYSITQAQWREVAGWEQVTRKLNLDPSRFKEDYQGIDRWTRPVENVSWDDAVEFCRRLSQKTGKKYRLPTEVEWEYACRAGTKTPFHFGETISTELANYNDNQIHGKGNQGKYRKQTTPVGYFQVANNFGLSDMHGNVWEWCKDDWHGNYENAPNDDSARRSQKSTRKVVRGGSWYNDSSFCRSAIHYIYRRVNYHLDVGFRVVCVAPGNKS